MRRVAMVGNSGSGKTTLGSALARLLDVPFTELDSHNHQPNWQPLPVEEFRRRVADLAAADGWVIDGNYSVVQDLVWERADTVVWFDLPRRKVMRQVVGRTLSRGVRRRELWNGNRESVRQMFRWDPEQSVIRWAWTRHTAYQERYAALTADPAYASLRVVRIRSREDARRLLAQIQ